MTPLSATSFTDTTGEDDSGRRQNDETGLSDRKRNRQSVLPTSNPSACPSPVRRSSRAAAGARGFQHQNHIRPLPPQTSPLLLQTRKYKRQKENTTPLRKGYKRMNNEREPVSIFSTQTTIGWEKSCRCACLGHYWLSLFPHGVSVCPVLSSAPVLAEAAAAETAKTRAPRTAGKRYNLPLHPTFS